jgi:hypothetical protein
MSDTSSDAADMMLALMRGGAPNPQVLAAKTIDDLHAIAHEHGINMPTPRSPDFKQVREEAKATAADGARSPTGGLNTDSGVDAENDPTSVQMAWLLNGAVSGRGGYYEGERNAKGEWEGFGKYCFTDGSIYEGEWRANQQHGHGTFLYASGNRYVGQWRAGKKDGKGTFGFADGRVEVGTYMADNDVGEGAMWSADRRTAWRIVDDGLEVGEISLDEAEQIAGRIGEPVPCIGDWFVARRLSIEARCTEATE